MLGDAHLHLFSGGFPGPDGRPLLGRNSEIDAYNELRIAYGITSGLVVGYEAGGIDPNNNSYLRRLAASNPWISSVAYLEVAPVPTAKRIEYILAQGHAGIAVYLPDAQSGRTLSSWPSAVWDAINAGRAVVSLNARPEATGALWSTIERTPDAVYAFAHLGLPGPSPTNLTRSAAGDRIGALLGLSRLANVYVKLSGLYAVQGGGEVRQFPSAANTYVDLLLSEFGASRCMWGSDFSPVLGSSTFQEALALEPVAKLSASERDMVMGGTLELILESAGR